MRQPFPIQPIRTGDRQIDGHANAVRQSVADLYTRVPGDGASRIVTPDDYTQLYWPCDEESGATLANRGVNTSGPLLVSAGATSTAGALGGLAHPRCARMYGAAATRGFAAATAGPTFGDSFTLSCIATACDFSADRILAGYWDTAGGTAIFALVITTAGLPVLYVRTLAGLLVVPGLGDMQVSPGSKIVVAGTYDGSIGSIYCNSVGASSGASVSPIDWAYGGTRRWSAGYPGSANSNYGTIQEIRGENCSRSAEFVRASYATTMGLAA